MLQRLVSAVQPTDAWRELCVFRKSGAKWTIRVLPPADSGPNVGYAEFAGWVHGGTQMLVVHEAVGRGKHKREFELPGERTSRCIAALAGSIVAAANP
jgi:hypothetical protein